MSDASTQPQQGDTRTMTTPEDIHHVIENGGVDTALLQAFNRIVGTRLPGSDPASWCEEGNAIKRLFTVMTPWIERTMTERGTLLPPPIAGETQLAPDPDVSMTTGTSDEPTPAPFDSLPTIMVQAAWRYSGDRETESLAQHNDVWVTDAKRARLLPENTTIVHVGGDRGGTPREVSIWRVENPPGDWLLALYQRGEFTWTYDHTGGTVILTGQRQ